ncbi:MAG TPA: acyclic terpene utilization AtuA family protein, partial [Rhodospirillales bacterium]|nr:acyclic terpene utilization AtuA family protein [Rhodospirillales bacterium]
MSEVVRVGGGAGYLDDRIEGAVELLERGELDYVMLDYLAERTLAILQEAKQAGGVGFAADLDRRMREILPPAASRGVKIVSNLGGADPAGAAAVVREVADSLDFKDLKIAVVEGDDVADLVRELDPVLVETGEPFSHLGKELISANAYIGAFEMAAAIGAGADVVLAGRAADPALALAPLIHEFGWSRDDLDRLALGTM